MNELTMLKIEIERLYDKLAELEPDSKEYEAVNKNLATLLDKRIEIEKLEMAETRDEKQLIEERNARLLKLGCDVLLGVAGLGLTYWGACVSFEFEKNDSISTQVGKKFMDKLLRK